MGALGMTLLALFVRALLPSLDVPTQDPVGAVCEPGGLDDSRIDELRTYAAHSTDPVTREELLELFDKPLDGAGAIAACRRCTEAIIDISSKSPFVP